MEYTIGDRIRYFRNRMGISQEALALKADMHPAHLGKLERNEKNPTMATMDKIIAALGVSYACFFSDAPELDGCEADRYLYMDRITTSLQKLPDEKLKAVAEVVVKVVEMVG